MLDILGQGCATTCNGTTRRDFLKVGALGAIGFSLADFFAAKAAGRVIGRDERSAIMIFNLGAPSQLDTFDMKPDAPAEIRGPFKPISTKSPDIQISEIFPLHAKVADKFSLVRSCHHGGAAVHDAGWQVMQTGRVFTGGVNTPHVGSVVSALMGRRSDLPAFVVLPPVEFDAARLARRQKLRQVVDSAVKDFEGSENAKLMDENFHAAFRLMSSREARAAFDLSKESPAMRERYGLNRFGQCCLLARRLVEAGVRFVTINTFLTVFDEITWDIHGTKPFTSIEGMKNIVAPMYDRAYSALIEDLDQRGMLDATLVCNLAEFGRTPRVNPAGGRDHWPQCFTCYFAGGGVQGGRVVGSSDPIAAVPADRPVEPADIVATIFHSLGLNLV